jgi:hypothetical protein
LFLFINLIWYFVSISTKKMIHLEKPQLRAELNSASNMPRQRLKLWCGTRAVHHGEVITPENTDWLLDTNLQYRVAISRCHISISSKRSITSTIFLGIVFLETTRSCLGHTMGCGETIGPGATRNWQSCHAGVATLAIYGTP